MRTRPPEIFVPCVATFLLISSDAGCASESTDAPVQTVDACATSVATLLTPSDSTYRAFADAYAAHPPTLDEQRHAVLFYVLLSESVRNGEVHPLLLSPAFQSATKNLLAAQPSLIPTSCSSGASEPTGSPLVAATSRPLISSPVKCTDNCAPNFASIANASADLLAAFSPLGGVPELVSIYTGLQDALDALLKLDQSLQAVSTQALAAQLSAGEVEAALKAVLMSVTSMKTIADGALLLLGVAETPVEVSLVGVATVVATAGMAGYGLGTALNNAYQDWSRCVDTRAAMCLDAGLDDGGAADAAIDDAAMVDGSMDGGLDLDASNDASVTDAGDADAGMDASMDASSDGGSGGDGGSDGGSGADGGSDGGSDAGSFVPLGPSPVCVGIGPKRVSCLDDTIHACYDIFSQAAGTSCQPPAVTVSDCTSYYANAIGQCEDFNVVGGATGMVIGSGCFYSIGFPPMTYDQGVVMCSNRSGTWLP